MTIAALGTVPGQLVGLLGREADRLGRAVVVVDAEKPMTRLQVVTRRPGQDLQEKEKVKKRN